MIAPKIVTEEQGLSQKLFSKSEAEEKQGRSVEVLRQIGEIPPGTRGKVALLDKTSDGYEVAIEWNFLTSSTPPRPRRTWINKEEYEESLIEVEPA